MAAAALIAVLALCWTGCTSRSPVGTASPEVEQQVRDVYAVVFEHYEYVTDGDYSALEALDSMYCTAAWNALLARVDDKDSRQAPGMAGFHEADYWVMGQDWSDLAVSDVHVTAMTDTTATVELRLHNSGHVTPVALSLKHERGTWLIDNFTDLDHGHDWQAMMREYLDGPQN